MTDVFTPTGDLRPIVGFDFESYLITENLGAPRAVCGTLATLGKFPDLTGIPFKVLERRTSPVPHEVALLLADDMVRVMALLLADAANDDVVLVAQNSSFDFGVLMQHAHLMRMRGDLGTPEQADEFVNTLWCDIFDALDVEGTGLPDSDGNVIDTKWRERLIKNAGGEMLHGCSLADLTKKYLGVDRSEGKKGNPCSKCNATGKVATVTTPEPCPVCMGAKYLKPWRLRFAELDGVPLDDWPQAPIDYALDDALDVVLVALAQSGDFGTTDTAGGVVLITDLGSVHYEAAQVRAALALHLEALNGPRSNPVALDAWTREMEGLTEEGLRIGKEAGFVRDNGTKDVKVLKHLVELAYEAKGKSAPTTGKGNTKTDEATIRASGDATLISWIDTGEGRQATEKFIPAAQRGLEAAVFSSPDAFKATDRTSWARPCFHQPPRKDGFRQCWEPRASGLDGRRNVYISADWSGAELCALAQIQYLMFDNSVMRDLVNEHGPGALHIELARQMWNAEQPGDAVDLDGATARYASGDAAWCGSQGLRQLAKIANFGFAGGLSASTFIDYAKGYGTVLTLEESEGVRNAWLGMGANQEYLDFFNVAASNDGFSYASWVTGMIRGNVQYTTGCNHGFQSMVAAALKVALWWSTREMYSDRMAGERSLDWTYPHTPGDPDTGRPVSIRVPYLSTSGLGELTSPLYGWRSWLSIHDEILLEGPEEEADAAARRLREVMEMALAVFTPDVVVEAEPGVGRRWSKGFKPAFDSDGKFVPWDG